MGWVWKTLFSLPSADATADEQSVPRYGSWRDQNRATSSLAPSRGLRSNQAPFYLGICYLVTTPLELPLHCVRSPSSLLQRRLTQRRIYEVGAAEAAGSARVPEHRDA